MALPWQERRLRSSPVGNALHPALCDPERFAHLSSRSSVVSGQADTSVCYRCSCLPTTAYPSPPTWVPSLSPLALPLFLQHAGSVRFRTWRCCSLGQEQNTSFRFLFNSWMFNAYFRSLLKGQHLRLPRVARVTLAPFLREL